MGKKLVVSNVSKCVECRICTIICSFMCVGEFKPSGSKIQIYRDVFGGNVNIKIDKSCDLCGGNPECVKWCPAGVFRVIKER